MCRLVLLLLPLRLCGPRLPPASPDPGRAFARCEGRLAALVQFGWLFGGHDHAADALRPTFSDLGQAIGPAAIRAWGHSRTHATSDQARLLGDARFASDDRRRRIAATIAGAHPRRCRAPVFG